MLNVDKKYHVYYSDAESAERICTTDSPNTAIIAWFEAQAEHPSCVAINAISKGDACFLIDFAHHRKDVIQELHGMYKNPYKLDFMLEAIDKKHKDRCRGFAGYMDQVHPFDLG